MTLGELYARAEDQGVSVHDMPILAERVRALRVAKGMSQAELAEKIDVGRATIARIETSHGKYFPLADILQKIADEFDVSLDYLTGRTDCPQILRHGEGFIDIQTAEVYRLFVKLTPDDQEAALAVLRSMARGK